MATDLIDKGGTVLRETHLISLPEHGSALVEGGACLAFTVMLQKGAHILEAMNIDGKARVIILIDPKQAHYELHHFFAIVVGNVATLQVDDHYCGMVSVGGKWCAVYHQPAKTKAVEAPCKSEL